MGVLQWVMGVLQWVVGVAVSAQVQFTPDLIGRQTTIIGCRSRNQCQVVVGVVKAYLNKAGLRVGNLRGVCCL